MMYDGVVCEAVLSLCRLPQTQDCHEMWSRKRRKKEGKEGGGAPPGKDPQSRSSSLPPARLSSPRKPKPNSSKSHVAPPASSPPPHPPMAPQPPPPPRVEPKPLANPYLKPNLTVPLPSAPLNPATILDSLHRSLHDPPPSHVNNVVPPLPVAPVDPSIAVGAPMTQVLPTIPPGVLPVAQISTGGGGSSVTAVAQQQAQHLQKVIEAQRTQLALLSQLTQQLQGRAGGGTSVTGGDGARHSPVPPGVQNLDFVGPGGRLTLPPPPFDKEYSVRGEWP